MPIIHSPQSSTPVGCFAAWQKQALFRCKRGNLEVELILTAHIRQLKDNLPKQEAERIDCLLNESEQDLFHWLINIHESSPLCEPPNQYRTLITQIKANYLNSQ